MNSRVALALAVLLASLTGVAEANDLVFPIPSGYAPEWSMFDSSGGNVVVVFTAQSGADSRVQQYRATGGVVTTTLPGVTVKAVEFSAGGNYVLASGIASDDSQRVTLINAAGAVSWTLVSSEEHHFSSDGGAIWSLKPRASLVGNRPLEVRIRNLNGTEQDLWRIEKAIDAVVAQSGNVVVCAVGRSVIAYDRDQTGAAVERWRYDLPDREQGIVGLVPFGPDTVCVQQSFNLTAKFLSISSGSLIYAFDANALAANGGRAANAYQALTFYSSADAQHVLLSDGTASGLTLTLSTGALTPKSLNVSAPPGFRLVREIRSGTRVLFSASAVRIRIVG